MTAAAEVNWPSVFFTWLFSASSMVDVSSRYWYAIQRCLLVCPVPKISPLLLQASLSLILRLFLFQAPDQLANLFATGHEGMFLFQVTSFHIKKMTRITALNSVFWEDSSHSCLLKPLAVGQQQSIFVLNLNSNKTHQWIYLELFCPPSVWLKSLSNGHNCELREGEGHQL